MEKQQQTDSRNPSTPPVNVAVFCCVLFLTNASYPHSWLAGGPHVRPGYQALLAACKRARARPIGIHRRHQQRWVFFPSKKLVDSRSFHKRIIEALREKGSGSNAGKRGKEKCSPSVIGSCSFFISFVTEAWHSTVTVRYPGIGSSLCAGLGHRFPLSAACNREQSFVAGFHRVIID